MNQAIAQAEMATQPDRHSLWEHIVALVFGGPMRKLAPPPPKPKVNVGAIDVLVTFRNSVTARRSFQGEHRADSGWNGRGVTFSGKHFASQFLDGKGVIRGDDGKLYPRHEVVNYVCENPRDCWVET